MIFNKFGYKVEIAQSSLCLPPGSKGQHHAMNATWIKVNDEDWICLRDVGTRHSFEWAFLLNTCESKEDIETFIEILKEEVDKHNSYECKY